MHLMHTIKKGTLNISMLGVALFNGNRLSQMCQAMFSYIITTKSNIIRRMIIMNRVKITKSFLVIIPPPFV